MNIMELGALGEFVGSIGVIATLVYLAIQIRQNSRTLQSTSFQESTNSLNYINMQAATDSELIRVVASDKSFDEFDPEDKARYGLLMLSIFRVTETTFYQRNEGTVAMAGWTRQEATLRRQLLSPLVRDWWRSTPFGFTPEFTTLVEGVITEAGPDRSFHVYDESET